MEGRTVLRIVILVSCVGLTALGYRNSNGDNTDAVAFATRTACGEADCSASLMQQARGSFGHEYGFQVERGVAGKKRPEHVIVSCQRELVLLGDWKCEAKSPPAPPR
jgi:hypothetical protein